MLPALVVLGASQLLGAAMVAVAALMWGLGKPEGFDLLYAAGAGVALTLGLGALYRAMAVGEMSIAAPIAATGVAIPVAIGIIGGDRPSMLQMAGLAAAALGIVLCAAQGRVATKSRSAPLTAGVGLALLAALGGGLTQTSLAAASSAGVLWVLLIQRTTVGSLAFGGVLLTRRSPELTLHTVSAIAAIGSLDLIATGLFTAATLHGALSLVAVVGSLYPVVTTVLAMVVLSERLATHQTLGAVCALAGVVAISSG
jgi:drug/metabolite transporter (DMT)-like permease